MIDLPPLTLLPLGIYAPAPRPAVRPVPNYCPNFPSDSFLQFAYQMRKQENNIEWRCLKEETKILLARIESRFGRVTLISTCRRGATIAGTGRISQHALGRAIDFEPNPLFPKANVVQWLINAKICSGIMTYRYMSHIHVDLGAYHFISLNSNQRN